MKIPGLNRIQFLTINEILSQLRVISSFEKDELLKYCADLQIALTDGLESDIEAVFFCDELISIQHFTKINDCNSPFDVLNLIKKNQLEDLYPNIWIALRILFTIPVTVASGERSFSKLKLIKPT